MDIVVWNENVHESRGDATVLSHYRTGSTRSSPTASASCWATTRA
ncbi:hypothetical protein BC477_04915 [Clavibacter michiganensis subsp. michiganensis]|uniref:Uncharacterized protein n=1 Tax=Clavibacter michiganensis subsp. michiganensis TaxID=33013 RepID=A0A251XKW4_CLAMM|nr:hypothetical protein BC477_04915 [Clavibacter michiganensis subsp. michiganensis]OUE04056.1 hypothetical protein CMMCAS07_03845 [Clavibacter michiganensis subsp. michiganensis]